MKVIPLKSLFLSNASLKIISLFFGYSFWYIASIHHPTTINLSVPLCFNASDHDYTIEAPENIIVTLQGKRSDLYALDTSTLAAHINIDKLLPGKHGIIITHHHLFLAPTLSLICYKPTNASITITQK